MDKKVSIILSIILVSANFEFFSKRIKLLIQKRLSLFSSTKGSFNFNPEARSSEVGEDDILLATWRESRDEEKSNGGKGFPFLERKPENRNKNLAFPKEERTIYRDKIGR